MGIDEDIALLVTYYYEILVIYNGAWQIVKHIIQCKIFEAFDPFHLTLKYFFKQLFLFGLI